MNYRRLFIPNCILFITIVTSKRRKILIDNIEYLRKAFVLAKQKFSYQIIAICILKDHLHMMIKPENITDYPYIIKEIKSNFSKMIDTTLIENYKESSSRKSKGEKDIWQRRYYEHTIAYEKDYYRHFDYIHYNPVKHGYVSAAKYWEYSSFHKYVKDKIYDIDWCNLEDKFNINDLDYE